ncbi:MAG: DegT/DnrJ/EryC1/StrS family aminotransferase [Clostridia bacterium]|nr:DegT/DnrJ/EryC1/StrS family aminotransferase [Clostridia bacterium]
MGYNIPLFNLNFDEAEEKAVVEVLKSKWISSGPKCAELEKTFADMLGVKYCLTVSNCTSALHLAMLCAGIEPGDEVIVPSLTFVATVNAVRYCGGIPVFCDITGKDNLCINPNKIEELITAKTKAVAVMHYGGFACDMDKICEIADRYNLKVIEDSCHGPTSEYKGKKLGTIGMAGCFSFFSNKNISTGEGGAIVTNDEAVFNKAKLLKSHGMTTMSYERSKGHSTSYDVVELGYNYRFNDILAGIGLAQLKKLENDIEKRVKIRELYNKKLDKRNLIIPFENYTEKSSLYIFPVVLADGDAQKRDKIRSYLAEKGIQTSIHYPPAHRFDIYKNTVRNPLPVTEYVADNEFTLPMFGALTEEEVNYICENVNEGLKLL